MGEVSFLSKAAARRSWLSYRRTAAAGRYAEVYIAASYGLWPNGSMSYSKADFRF